MIFKQCGGRWVYIDFYNFNSYRYTFLHLNNFYKKKNITLFNNKVFKKKGLYFNNIYNKNNYNTFKKDIYLSHKNSYFHRNSFKNTDIKKFIYNEYLQNAELNISKLYKSYMEKNIYSYRVNKKLNKLAKEYFDIHINRQLYYKKNIYRNNNILNFTNYFKDFFENINTFKKNNTYKYNYLEQNISYSIKNYLNSLYSKNSIRPKHYIYRWAELINYYFEKDLFNNIYVNSILQNYTYRNNRNFIEYYKNIFGSLNKKIYNLDYYKMRDINKYILKNDRDCNDRKYNSTDINKEGINLKTEDLDYDYIFDRIKEKIFEEMSFIF